MPAFHTVLCCVSFATLSACTARQPEHSLAPPTRESAPAMPAKAADPMANFARMLPGEWRRTFANGTSMFDTWHWGPGRHSMRVMTQGHGADGTPWRALTVYFWHPGLQQVRLRGFSSYARGISDGTISFDGDTANGTFDLLQFDPDPNRNPRRRKLALRWTFDGPDKYRDALLEDTGAGFDPLAEWDHVRSSPPAEQPQRPIEADPKRSERLKAFEPFLAHAWEAKGNWIGGEAAAGQALDIQTTFEWIPYTDAIYARTFALTNGAEPTHLLDAYIYHHHGLNALRCLALTNQGGVYEGDVVLLDAAADGSMQLDLQGHESERVVQRLVRFDLEHDGTLRHRVWTVEGADRTLALDIRHRKSKPKND